MPMLIQILIVHNLHNINFMRTIKIMIAVQTISFLLAYSSDCQDTNFLTPSIQLNAMESALNEFYKHMDSNESNSDINLILISNNIFHRKIGFEIDSLEDICKDCGINYSDTLNFHDSTEFSNNLHNKWRFKLTDLPENPKISLNAEYIYFNPIIKKHDGDYYLIAFICYEGYNEIHAIYKLRKISDNRFDFVSVVLAEFYQF